MGVQHFYLYYNGPIGAMLDDDPPAARALLRDPRVTLVQWNFQMWQTGAYRNVGDRPCVGHFAQMLSFNDAYLRFRHQHKYMGFFDFDEYPGMDTRFLVAAAAQRVTPLRLFFATYRSDPHADVAAVMFVNRWAFVAPGVAEGEPITRQALLARRVWGGAGGDFAARTKYVVRAGAGRAAPAGGPDAPPLLLGNHVVCRLQRRDAINARATVQWSGACVVPTEPDVRNIPGREAYSLHLRNLKPHVSLLDGSEEEMLARALADEGRSRIDGLAALLRQYDEF